MDFSQVEAEFQRLKGQFEAGTLTEEEFKAQLEELMIQDEEGKWWIIGYETGQWYYHDGDKWVQSKPPELGPTAPPTPVAEQRRVLELFREEGFLLHFLPTVVAGVVSGVVSMAIGIDPLNWMERNTIFAVAAVFLVWLVLRTRVTRRWQMVLALAASWEAGNKPTTLTMYMYTYLTMYGVRTWLYLMLEVASIFVLGLGLSFLFAKILEPRLFKEL